MTSIDHGPLDGIRVTVNPYIGSRMEQYRHPKSKRRRIRKKWRRDQRNWKLHEYPEIYEVNGYGLIVSRAAYCQLFKSDTPSPRSPGATE